MFGSKAVELHHPLVRIVMPTNFKRAFSEHVLTCSAIYCHIAVVPQAKSVTCFFIVELDGTLTCFLSCNSAIFIPLIHTFSVVS